MMIWISLANMLAMILNLGFYAYGEPTPANLAVGIFNGFMMLLCAPKSQP